MTTKVEFFFDVGSPTAYLAWCRLLQLREQYDMDLQFRPLLLGGVFKATDNASPVTIPAKGRYMMGHDLPRFAALEHVVERLLLQLAQVRDARVERAGLRLAL